MSAATNFTLCIGIVLFLTFPSISQDKLRGVDESNPRYNYPSQPVTIIGRELGRKSFSKETKIWGGISWLKELRLTVKNTSGKTLIWLYLELMVDKHGNLPTQVGIPLEFGSISVPLDANGKPQTDVVLKPSETVRVSVGRRQLPPMLFLFMTETVIASLPEFFSCPARAYRRFHGKTLQKHPSNYPSDLHFNDDDIFAREKSIC
ncbi:MAG: hypothetical protein ABI539_13040 [Acidobacteriota bacterium]